MLSSSSLLQASSARPQERGDACLRLLPGQWRAGWHAALGPLSQQQFRARRLQWPSSVWQCEAQNTCGSIRRQRKALPAGRMRMHLACGTRQVAVCPYQQ